MPHDYYWDAMPDEQDDPPLTECRRCGGTGVLMVSRVFMVSCPDCQGTGEREMTEDEAAELYNGLRDAADDMRVDEERERRAG